MKRISGLKHLVVYFVVVIVIGLGVWWGANRYQNSNPNQSHTIVGQVISATGGTIVLLGVHTTDADTKSPDMTHATRITIKTDYGTGYFNTVWPTVTKAMIAKRASNSFQTFQSKTVQGSFADMSTKNLYITVITREESSGLDSAMANMIKYNTIKP